MQQTLEAANAQISTLQNAPAPPQAPPQASTSGEELEKIKSELAAKQREIEALKATAEVAASSNAAPEDGSKPVAELVKEQVDQISSRLTAEHNQRIAEEEEKYKKRADSMKIQLSKKLSEGKQTIREEEKIEHDKAINQLKLEHLAELERLRTEHREEIQNLQAQTGAAVAVVPGGSNGTTASEGSGVKLSELTNEQLKELLQTNDKVKAIIRGNVESGIKKQTAQIKQEEQKTWTIKLDEIEKAAEESKKNAVELEGKKMKVKLSMLENRGRTMTAQINVVKKAVEETPQRAVGEVWEEAKIAKPPPAAPPASIPATPSTNPAGPVSTTQPSTTPATQQQRQPPQANAPPTPSPAPSMPATANAAAPTLAPRNGTSDNPLNRSNGPSSGPGQSRPGVIVAPSGAPGGRGTPPFANTQQPPSGPSTNQQQQQSNMPRPAQAVGTGPAALKHVLNQNPGSNQNPALNQPLSSGIPRGGGLQRGGRGVYQGRGGMHPQQQQQGSGHQQQQDLNIAGAARGGSNLPRGPGGVGRGGRGRGQVNIQGHQGQQGGPSSPSGGRGGSLNPGARQFNPGAGIKRPHEGGEGGNVEKKARGQGE